MFPNKINYLIDHTYLGYMKPGISFMPYFVQVNPSSGGILYVFPNWGSGEITIVVISVSNFFLLPLINTNTQSLGQHARN